MDDRRVWGACVRKGRKPQRTPHSTLACLPVVSHSISSCGNQSRLLTSPIACAARFMGFLRPCSPNSCTNRRPPRPLRPPQVIAVCKSADLLLMVLDATKPWYHRDILTRELEAVGMRLNRCVGPLLGIMQDQQDQQAAHISTTPVAHENTHTQSAACIHASVHMRTGVSSCTAVV